MSKLMGLGDSVALLSKTLLTVQKQLLKATNMLVEDRRQVASTRLAVKQLGEVIKLQDGEINALTARIKKLEAGSI